MKITEDKFTLSKHVQFLPLEDGLVAVAHGLALRRSVFREEVAEHLKVFRTERLTSAEFARIIGGPDLIAARLFEFFAECSYIVPTGIDEDEEMRHRLRVSIIAPTVGATPAETTQGRWFDVPVPLSLETFNSGLGGVDRQLERLSVALLGGCFTQSAADIVEEVGLAYGYCAHVTASWPEDHSLIHRQDARLVVFQPATMWLLGPLWDGTAFIDDEERTRRLGLIKDYLSTAVKRLLHYAPGRLILVQGVCPPQIPPHGRLDFRLGMSFSRILFEVNNHLQELIRDQENAIFVDEARIFANHGIAYLMDDMVNVYSHHAPLDFSTAPKPEGASRARSFELRTRMLAVRLLAKEYFECYRLWLGHRKIKCIIVDLDDTLWPGEVGDSHFSLEGYEPFEFLRYGRFGGLHQALKIMKQRGVMLATCSGNDQDEVMRHWRALGVAADASGNAELRTAPPEDGEALSSIDYLLRPDDFVLHKINWRRKSENIAEIASELGIGLDSILFIDDNPIRREEVCWSLPEVRTLGSDMNLVRLSLLSDPCLEFNTQSRESATRTDMVRSQLRRNEEASKALDETTFLRGLGIKMRVERVSGREHLNRIVELLQRTNQFNTSGVRFDAYGLASLTSETEGRIYVAHVTDKFNNYGVVGVCIIAGTEVVNFVLSCRVIGLQVAVPFLVTVLRNQSLPITARIVKTDRNRPCHDFYVNAGFCESGDGLYVLADKASLRLIDKSVYEICVDDLADNTSASA